MGICSSCLGLNRRSSEDSQDEQDPLLYSSSNRAYGGTGADAHDISHDNHNPRQDAERLRQEASALEAICAHTADKMIDVSEGFGVSKIDSDFRRLFSEAFSPGLLEGPPIQTKPDNDDDLEVGESASSPPQQRIVVATSPDIVNAKNESEWFHAIMKAAKAQASTAEQDASKTWDGDTVVEIDRPLVFTLEEQTARRHEQE